MGGCFCLGLCCVSAPDCCPSNYKTTALCSCPRARKPLPLARLRWETARLHVSLKDWKGINAAGPTAPSKFRQAKPFVGPLSDMNEDPSCRNNREPAPSDPPLCCWHRAFSLPGGRFPRPPASPWQSSDWLSSRPGPWYLVSHCGFFAPTVHVCVCFHPYVLTHITHIHPVRGKLL